MMGEPRGFPRTPAPLSLTENPVHTEYVIRVVGAVGDGLSLSGGTNDPRRDARRELSASGFAEVGV